MYASSQFTDMLALCGDASDNVPGVRGIGPKTAAPLLQQYGDVEGVLAAAAEVTLFTLHTAACFILRT
jgi:DNA polymerase I